MGLAVSVYKNIKQTNDESSYSFMAYVLDDDWKDRIKNLQENAIYQGDRVFKELDYPYGTHGRFREFLIRLIGREDLLNDDGRIKWKELAKNREIPFYELINFADNEGCLDWECSEKLFGDFYEFMQKAMKECQSEHQVSIYLAWYNTFFVAKDKGVVVFS